MCWLDGGVFKQALSRVCRSRSGKRKHGRAFIFDSAWAMWVGLALVSAVI